jgi:hypothetical protein
VGEAFGHAIVVKGMIENLAPGANLPVLLGLLGEPPWPTDWESRCVTTRLKKDGTFQAELAPSHFGLTTEATAARMFGVLSLPSRGNPRRSQGRICEAIDFNRKEHAMASHDSFTMVESEASFICSSEANVYLFRQQTAD